MGKIVIQASATATATAFVLSLVIDSGGASSALYKVCSIQSTCIIDDLLGIVAQLHEQEDIAMEDNSILGSQRELLQNTSDNNDWTHIYFGKDHLQVVTDKPHPKHQCCLNCNKG